MKYINRTPELCEFMNTLQTLAEEADSRAKNLLLGKKARMRAEATCNAYLFAVSFADSIFGGMRDD